MYASFLTGLRCSHRWRCDPPGDVYIYDFASVGFELWTVNNGTIFDNVLVTDDLEYAKSFGASTWGKIKDGEKDAKEKYDNKDKEEEGEKKEDL